MLVREDMDAGDSPVGEKYETPPRSPGLMACACGCCVLNVRLGTPEGAEGLMVLEDDVCIVCTLSFVVERDRKLVLEAFRLDIKVDPA